MTIFREPHVLEVTFPPQEAAAGSPARARARVMRDLEGRHGVWDPREACVRLARLLAGNAITEPAWQRATRAVSQLPASEWSLTLPDGTLLEACVASWLDIYEGLGIGDDEAEARFRDTDGQAAYETRILDAFNAMQRRRAAETRIWTTTLAEIERLLATQGVSLNELGRRAGRVPHAFGKLRSQQNVRLRTLAAVGWALNVRFVLIDADFPVAAAIARGINRGIQRGTIAEEGERLFRSARTTIDAQAQHRHVRRSEIARRLDVRRTLVTHFFHRHTGTTVRTLGAYGWAIETELALVPVPFPDPAFPRQYLARRRQTAGAPTARAAKATPAGSGKPPAGRGTGRS